MSVVATYMLVCVTACSVPNPSAAANPGTAPTQQVTAGYVEDRILWDGVTPYAPPSGYEVKADDGTPIGGTTAP